jgi:hypothetical protein
VEHTASAKEKARVKAIKACMEEPICLQSNKTKTIDRLQERWWSRG